MLAFEDSTLEVDEGKNARLDARVKPSVKKAIHQAAELNGVDFDSFLASVAYDAARLTISSHEVTVLKSEADKKVFFDALDNPPKPTKRLRDAFALHKKMVANDD